MNSPWIVSRRFDLTWLSLGPWTLAFAVFLVARAGPTGVWVAILAFSVLDSAHQLATYPLTVFDRESRAGGQRDYAIGIGVIVAFALIAGIVGGSIERLWLGVVLVWGPFHTVRQHYGFIRLYQARCRPASAAQAEAETLLLYCGALWPYASALAGGKSYGFTGRDWLPPVPEFLPVVAFCVSAFAALRWLLQSVHSFRSGDAGLWVRSLYLLIAVSNFWLGFWLAKDIGIVFAPLFISVLHGVQYLALTTWVGQRRSTRIRTNALFRWRNAWAFVPAMLAGGAMMAFGRRLELLHLGEHQVQMIITHLLIVILYSHYLLDGKLWRLRDNHGLRLDLRLSEAAKTPQ